MKPIHVWASLVPIPYLLVIALFSQVSGFLTMLSCIVLGFALGMLFTRWIIFTWICQQQNRQTDE